MTTTATKPEPTVAPKQPDHTFTDAAGRTWPLRRLTMAVLDDAKAAGLDLDDADESIDHLAAVVGSPRKLAALLWWFVGDAVTAAGVTPQDFNNTLDGEALNRAVVAIRDAVIWFSPYPAAYKARMIDLLNNPVPVAAAPAPTAAGEAASIPQQQLDAVRQIVANTAVPTVTPAAAG